MEKTRCKNHPSEFISNFCANDTCMIELCATCICEHTQYHHQHLNTLPRYQNIKNTLSITNQKLAHQKDQLNQAKNHLKKLMGEIGSKKKEIQNLLRATKQDVFQAIQKVFQEMEKQLLNQLELQKQKTGLHREQHLQKLYIEVNKASIQIYQKAQQLNSFKYPEMIRKINRQTFSINKIFLEQINKQIQQNQLFKMQVLYQPHSLKEIVSGVRKIITTSFSYPSRKNQQKQAHSFQNARHSVNKCPYRQNRQSRSPFVQRNCNNNNEGCEGMLNKRQSFVSSGLAKTERSPINRPLPSMQVRTQENWYDYREKGTPKFHQTYGF